jgi:tetratricopeptide (TPR) repeat protein
MGQGDRIRIDPSLSAAYAYRGHAHLRRHQWKCAIADLTRAIELSVDFPSNKSAIHCHRGYVFCQTGEFDKAMEDFTEAIRLNPRNAEAFYNRAISYQEIGETSKSEKDFAQAKMLGYTPTKNP